MIGKHRRHTLQMPLKDAHWHHPSSWRACHSPGCRRDTATVRCNCPLIFCVRHGRRRAWRRRTSPFEYFGQSSARPLQTNTLNLLPLSEHRGHCRICCWLDPVATDPERSLSIVVELNQQPTKPNDCNCDRRHMNDHFAVEAWRHATRTPVSWAIFLT